MDIYLVVTLFFENFLCNVFLNKVSQVKIVFYRCPFPKKLFSVPKKTVVAFVIFIISLIKIRSWLLVHIIIFLRKGLKRIIKYIFLEILRYVARHTVRGIHVKIMNPMSNQGNYWFLLM